MEAKLFSLFTILVLLFITVEGKVFFSHACEGNKMKMFCHSGDVIKVVHADYGRSNASICEYFDDPNMDLNCHSDTATAIVKKRCNGKLRCRVEATNELFSDPCPGQVKYVEATYKCVSKPEHHAHHHMVRTFTHGNDAISKKREVKRYVEDVEEPEQSEESDDSEESDSSEEPETNDELELSEDEVEIKPKIRISMHQELKYIPNKKMDATDILF